MSRIPFNKPSIVVCEIDHVLEAIDRGPLSGEGIGTVRDFVRLTRARFWPDDPVPAFDRVAPATA